MISYWFDVPSAWTDLEKKTVGDALTLWSVFANVQFELSASSAADVTFFRISGNSSTANYPLNPPPIPDGSSQAATIVSVSTGYTDAGSDTLGGAQPLGSPQHFTLLHEIGHILSLGMAAPTTAP